MRRAFAALVVACALVACGGDSEREPAGFRRDPAPNVGDFSLPDIAAGGREQPFRAEPGGLLVVYFGYTNCPDVCPTTLADLRAALDRIDGAERVDPAMVTVDPDRDTAVLADYVVGFFDRGHALATDDPGRLAQVAAPFGVTYEVTEGDDGDVSVSHTPWLYAVDDEGVLVMTWPFGTKVDDLAADLEMLLEDVA